MDLNTQKALASLGSAMNGYQAALTPWALPVNQPPNQMPDMTGTGSASTASWLPLIHDQLTKMGTSLANLEKASKPAPNKETSQQSQMQGGGSSDPLQAWANQYLRSLGGKLGGQVSQYFGNDAGRLAQTGYQQLFDRFTGRTSMPNSTVSVTNPVKFDPNTSPVQTAPVPPKPGTPPAGGGGGGRATTPAVPSGAGGGGAAAGGATTRAATAAVGGEAGAMAGAAAMTGPFVVVAAALLAAGAALIAFKEAVVAAANAQQDANFKYAEFSPQMAQIQAQAQATEAFRDRDTGERLAATAATLNQSIQRYNDTTREQVVLLETIKNVMAGAMLDAVTDILKPLQTLARWANWKMNTTDPEPGPDMGTLEDLARSAQREIEEHRRRGDDWFKRRRYD